MGSTLNFASTPKTWLAKVSATADGTPTARTPTGGTATLVTPGASGSKIEEVDIVSSDVGLDPCVVNLWLTPDSGTTYYLFDSFTLAGNDSTTTSQGERKPRQYANLILPSGTRLDVSCTVASQLIDVCAFGGDL